MNWDWYVYPGTNILKNKLDIQNSVQLEIVERDMTMMRIIQLEHRGVTGHFDIDHIKSIHRHIFGDVYDWAGEFREIDIGKGGDWFLQADMIPSELSLLCKDIQSHGQFDDVPITDVADILADVMCRVNEIHPFREGNGRTQRVFVRQIALHAGYELDFSKLSENSMRDASRVAMRGNTKPMQYLFRSVISPCKSDGVHILQIRWSTYG